MLCFWRKAAVRSGCRRPAKGKGRPITQRAFHKSNSCMIKKRSQSKVLHIRNSLTWELICITNKRPLFLFFLGDICIFQTKLIYPKNSLLKKLWEFPDFINSSNQLLKIFSFRNISSELISLNKHIFWSIWACKNDHICLPMTV